MAYGETIYKLPMDQFSPDEYGHVVAEARQLVEELNGGEATLPAVDKAWDASYCVRLGGPVLVALGVDRPSASFGSIGDELDGIELAFSSRFDGRTVAKLDDNLRVGPITVSELTFDEVTIPPSEPSFDELITAA